jgi:hypothetical protein
MAMVKTEKVATKEACVENNRIRRKIAHSNHTSM